MDPLSRFVAFRVLSWSFFLVRGRGEPGRVSLPPSTPIRHHAARRDRNRGARELALAEVLGADLLRIFLPIKRQGCARFAACVSKRDCERYLE
jgi:hypothetical protein